MDILVCFNQLSENLQKSLLITLIENFSTTGSWQENLNASEYETLEELCNDMFPENFAGVACNVAKNISGLD